MNQDTKLESLLGKGLVFPIQIDSELGRPVLQTGFELLKSSIKNILAFSLGRRPMLGEFGTLINKVLEEPNDAITSKLVFLYIKEAISKYESRIELLESTLVDAEDKLKIELRYKIVALNIEDTFIYPYYKANTDTL